MRCGFLQSAVLLLHTPALTSYSAVLLLYAPVPAPIKIGCGLIQYGSYGFIGCIGKAYTPVASFFHKIIRPFGLPGTLIS